jgi:hypothetical protein
VKRGRLEEEGVFQNPGGTRCVWSKGDALLPKQATRPGAEAAGLRAKSPYGLEQG